MEQDTVQAISESVTNGTQLSERREDGYFDLLAYIVSNAVAGEIMAIENYSEMVQLMPTTEAKIETVNQAKEECKHILLLSKLGRNLDFTVEKRIIEPQWNNIRKHFSAAVKKENLAACLITQDLMTETMAIMLYSTLAKSDDTDPQTAAMASNILADELEHLDIGVRRIQDMISNDEESVHDALVWAHHRVMPELFGMISTSCHFLCDELEVDCGSLALDNIRTDIDTLRVQALDRYIETLDMVGFDASVTNPLIASMTAYEGMSRMSVGFTNGEGGACCSPQDMANSKGKCC
ncbi:ferritin-like domain-containing protein [Candidatus Entotheonella palauensis]|uniref:ferritin-like domain-containing protein n=1 Tax=Candidatus Entotheonella palauensis TaxID=93172 RepID=UPI000B7E4FCC|nr:ferritin-like domain-containing protein [Candidatus Entotheonella palauensis]